MFAIYEPNKKMYMMKDHKDVIVFDDEQTAYNFANMFYNNYALPVAASSIFSEGLGLMHDVMNSSQAIQVIEVPNDFDKPTVNFNDLKN